MVAFVAGGIREQASERAAEPPYSLAKHAREFMSKTKALVHEIPPATQTAWYVDGNMPTLSYWNSMSDIVENLVHTIPVMFHIIVFGQEK